MDPAVAGDYAAGRCGLTGAGVAVRGVGRPLGASVFAAVLTREAYVGHGRSTTDIAAQVGCAPATIARRLRSAGIPLRRPGGAHPLGARLLEAGIRPGSPAADS